MRALAGLLFVIVVSGGCGERREASAPPPRSPAVCEDEKRALLFVVAALPDHALSVERLGPLPESTLGAAPLAGPVLVVSERALSLDGETVTPATIGERLGTRSAPKTLYVAAEPATTIGRIRAAVASVPKGVELSLLVRAHDDQASHPANTTPERAKPLVEGVLAERDEAARDELLRRGYEELASCQALSTAVARADAAPADKRWAIRRSAALEALPGCPCDTLQSPELGALFAAEQRAGTATLAAIPFSFVRDQRCGASMPLRSVARLLEQIERFDADYAGTWQDDALRFDAVVTNDRLLVQFCDALPGETLAALARAKATLYFRASGSDACQGFHFEPLSPGAPMGTWRRTAHAGPLLAFHYWQAAEEISVFGPLVAGTPSKPTDEHEWPCRTTLHLVGIDGDSIETDAGRLFFEERTCRAAPPSASAAPTACFASLGTGDAP